MATELGTKFLTLADWAKRVNPDGGIADVIEQIAETNPLLQDASMIEGNLPTGHRSTQRTTQPSGTWRQLNAGVAETKSTTRQVDDQAGMLEAYSAVDVKLARLNGNINAFRASEDAAFIQGLGEDATDAIIYGNSGVNPEQPHGLAPRYNSLTDTVGTTNVINAGGSGSDNSSLWLVTWGAKTTTLIHPKASPMGLQATDLGELPWDDASNNPYQAYVTHFSWDLGLSVPDYRYNVRICNIDISELTADGATGADLMLRMVSAFYARPTAGVIAGMTSVIWYCNKTIGEYLHHQASNKSNVNLTLENPAGEPMVRFLGAPVHIVDALTEAEATIS
ncbi:hypothetical protein LCGC14_0684690 [marine sediment metagenome]|uniref:Uncharacterized protein n=1 Tax=marine sediment metagenome TaxID=412755 RepID=A0A0F9TVA5_9ZZZZ